MKGMNISRNTMRPESPSANLAGTEPEQPPKSASLGKLFNFSNLFLPLASLSGSFFVAGTKRHCKGGNFMKITTATGVAFCSILFATTVSAAETAPGDVAINDDLEISKSLTGAPGDAAAGRKWFAGRKLGNCLACHETSDMKEQPFHGEVGPTMDGVAARYEENQLRAILVNSKKVFGDATIMPGFYSLEVGVRPAKKFQGKTILSAQQVEDVIAYLITLKE
jgi:sulfur-oxidizing protein SoxX